MLCSENSSCLKHLLNYCYVCSIVDFLKTCHYPQENRELALRQ